jgi:hypothetical protein
MESPILRLRSEYQRLEKLMFEVNFELNFELPIWKLLTGQVLQRYSSLKRQRKICAPFRNQSATTHTYICSLSKLIKRGAFDANMLDFKTCLNAFAFSLGTLSHNI